MTLPSFEVMVTIPTGGLAVSVTVDPGVGSPTAVTVPAGNYYLSSASSGSRGLLGELDYQLDTVFSGTAAFTLSMNSTTGKVTIREDSAIDFDLAWTSTTLRDILGFTGDLSSTDNYTGTEQAEYLWLPNVGAAARRASIGARGARQSDQRVNRSWSGEVVSTVYNRYTVERWTFRGLTKAKTWQDNESTVNESAERFWADHLSAGRAFRYYTDAASATSYLTASSLAREYRFSGGGFDENVRRLRDGYDGAWEWTFEGMLEV